MPRGRKKKVVLSLAEKIDAAKADIATLSKQLKLKKAELKQLVNEKADEKKNEIFAAIEASGKSYEDVLEMIKNAKWKDAFKRDSIVRSIIIAETISPFRLFFFLDGQERSSFDDFIKTRQAKTRN